jgi:hypothetical protein
VQNLWFCAAPGGINFFRSFPMKRRIAFLSAVVALALPVAAFCADPPPPKADAVKTVLVDKSNVQLAPAESVTAVEGLEQVTSGKVLETMNSGGYSYAKLGNGRSSTWIAFPAQQTRVGDPLSFNGCVEMRDFHSNSLNRNFELILFCGAPESASATDAKTTPAVEKATPAANGAVPAAAKKIKVDKAGGANAYTIQELYAKSAGLDGKEVSVKGQVVKVSEGIMGKNWIHLQDGSGNEQEKTGDVVVTSADLPAVGEVVTASGTLAKDKDFGSGYKYNVIIEKGSFKK